MKAEDLIKHSKEELEKKLSGQKTLIGLFIPIIGLLLYFFIRDYLESQEWDYLMATMTICSIGGLASVWPEFRLVKAELARRENSEK